ncbi:hypothetical protein [Micromonospora okii]|uniref:hypothetical protein n=1 Tax=Micromonospora okii TaxID=1182970 RepID=UPI001E5E9F77|nr:hypothetical protein [Micromonospora okii]
MSTRLRQHTRRSTLTLLTGAALATLLSVAPATAATAAPLDGRPGSRGGVGTAAPGAIVHQVPQVPLTINGEPVPASAITRYNGRPLYMAVVPGGSPNGQLQAFTKPADFERFVHEQGGPERVLTPEPAAARNPVSPPKRPGTGPGQTDNSVYAGSYLYSGDNGTFYNLFIPAGWAASNLKQVDMVCVVWCISWNDEASSAVSDYGMTLFEHIGFGGSALYISAGFHPYLGSYGWDNRTSSFRG